jgi:hypothetical protein
MGINTRKDDIIKYHLNDPKDAHGKFLLINSDNIIRLSVSKFKLPNFKILLSFLSGHYAKFVSATENWGKPKRYCVKCSKEYMLNNLVMTERCCGLKMEGICPIENDFNKLTIENRKFLNYVIKLGELWCFDNWTKKKVVF